MKKIISLVLVCVLLVGCVFALASCAKTLNGTYRLGDADNGTTYVFSGNTVECTISVLGFDKDTEGTYKIEENEEKELVLTITWADDDDDDTNNKTSSAVLVEGTEGGTKYIKLDGIQYNKIED